MYFILKVNFKIFFTHYDFCWFHHSNNDELVYETEREIFIEYQSNFIDINNIDFDECIERYIKDHSELDLNKLKPCVCIKNKKNYIKYNPLYEILEIKVMNELPVCNLDKIYVK